VEEQVVLLAPLVLLVQEKVVQVVKLEPLAKAVLLDLVDLQEKAV
jgi:hypothetical protein